jgi:hypothetical protein
MIENLVLSVDRFFLTLDVFDSDGVVCLVEGIELLEQYNSVFIRVNLLEQRTHLFWFQAQVEVFT